MPGLEHTASQLRGTQTDYQRIANAQSLAGPPPSWSFSSRAFTDATSNRELEISTHGCGITPRVWPDSDARISEVPVTSRQALRYATTALAQQGGLTPRRRAVDSTVAQLRAEATAWHQHDHERSTCDRKELRPIRVAGLNSARIGHIRTVPFHRTGVDDRPHWMSENEMLPGGWHFTPSDHKGDPTLFGRNAHFTAGFTCAPRKPG
mmetsp:Transcript_129341/g.322439  ORF Transcript_129341/g.322439 Transcript_129341/m.322439 type:complete len:207 (+) Transcript_129341:96-716(+)